MAHAFVVQHRGRHIAAVHGEGARERGGVLEGLRGALAERRKHRVRRVAEQTDAALHPGFERVTVVEAPLRGTNDRACQSEQVVSAGAPREGLVHLAKDLLPAYGKPVTLLLLERGRVGLIAGDPHVQQFAAAHPVRRRPAPLGPMAVHAEGVDGVVVQLAAVSLAERGDRRPRNEPAKAGHLGPALGTRVRPRQPQRGRIDPVGADENLSRSGAPIRKGRRHLVGGLTQLRQPAVHVHSDRARRPAVGTELEHPLVQAHQQVEPVHVMKPGAVARGGDMIERPLRRAPIGVELPCRLQDCRPAAVDRPVRTLGIPAVEVDAQPTAYPRPVGRDVQPGACGAGYLRLLKNIDRCEDAGLPQRQRGHQPAHSRTDNHCPHPVVLPKSASAPNSHLAGGVRWMSPEQMGRD